MDCSPPGSSVLGVFQAGILEWDAMPFSRGREVLNPVSNLCLWHLPALAGGFFTTGITYTLPHRWFDFIIRAILACLLSMTSLLQVSEGTQATQPRTVKPNQPSSASTV